MTGLGVVFNAWGASSELMEKLLNAPSAEADEWTRRWQEHKSTELQFVSVTVSRASKQWPSLER